MWSKQDEVVFCGTTCDAKVTPVPVLVSNTHIGMCTGEQGRWPPCLITWGGCQTCHEPLHCTAFWQKQHGGGGNLYPSLPMKSPVHAYEYTSYKRIGGSRMHACASWWVHYAFHHTALYGGGSNNNGTSMDNCGLCHNAIASQPLKCTT